MNRSARDDRPLRRAGAAFLALAIAGTLAACSGDDGRTRLIVYSPHGPDMLRAFEEGFEARRPDVDVQWIDMGSQEVLDRIRSERANPQADVWWGAPSQLFLSAAEEELLEPFAPSWADAVGEHRDPQNRFFGTYLTPEVIAYNSDAVDSTAVPRDWDDVLDPRWEGQVLIRDPLASGTMRTIFGMIIQRSIRETGSADAGFDWLRRLDGQTREYVLNPTLLYQKLARQEGLVTLWDMPDIEMLRARTGYPIDYVFPASGTPLVIDAIAVVRGAQHPDIAKEFVEYVGSQPALILAAREFFRLPARGDVPADSLPDVLRDARERIVPEPMDWGLLQERGAEWMRRWDETVRGEGVMLRLEGLTKRFGETVAVADLSLEVGQGEFLSLLGPSGCGKTTTLRMVAGFEAPTSGRILLGDRDVTALPPQRREMGMVFQSYALFPHLDVYENVAFGLRSQGVASGEIEGRVARALARVDLEGYARRRVQALSGGQQQRVALARALAPEPPLLLLDEPLSNLDAALRERTRSELRSLLKKVGITAVFVTHDQEEAFDLSDRIAVLRDGELQQVGSPEDLYDRPANAFVASFVGRASFLPARLVEGGGDAGDADAAGVCELEGGARWRVRRAGGAASGDDVTLMARPESLRLVGPDSDPDAIAGRVAERRFAGSVTMYRVTTGSNAELLVSGDARGAAVGDAVGVTLAAGAVAHAFPAGVIPSFSPDVIPSVPAEDLQLPSARHPRDSGDPGQRGPTPGFPPSRE